MSYTKALRKQLKKMDVGEITITCQSLNRQLETERNMCIRSSLLERVRMCMAALKERNALTFA